MGFKILHTLLFSTGKQGDSQAHQIKVRQLVSARFSGFSIFEGKGYWNGNEELSFQVLIATEDDTSILALIADLKNSFKQESIIEIRHTTANVIFHSS